jgi:hypothetical protein
MVFQPGQSGNPAGRPAGSGQKKPRLVDYATAQDVQEFVDWVKANYRSDIALAKWYGDQLVGRAMITVSANNSDLIEGTSEARKKMLSARSQLLGAGAAVGVAEILSEEEALEAKAQNPANTES